MSGIALGRLKKEHKVSGMSAPSALSTGGKCDLCVPAAVPTPRLLAN